MNRHWHIRQNAAAAVMVAMGGILIAANLTCAQPLQPEVLASFPRSFVGANGEHPEAALTQGDDGNFYGTTYNGGDQGFGTVFRVTTNGVLTTLYSFGTITGTNGNPLDGVYPEGGLTLGSDGDFYGTTWGGGDYGRGTVFRVTSSGVLTTVVSFNGTNGAYPEAPLTQGCDGNFYGTTEDGTVFRVTTSGALTTLASFDYRFEAPPDRSISALTPGSDGSFYGTTEYGGSNDCGTVFRVTTNGVLTTLYLFGTITDPYGNPLDGEGPVGLAMGPDGNFYGTTLGGGDYQYYGTVFQVTTNGVLTTLVSFDSDNGGGPNGLTLGNDGNFYGTTEYATNYDPGWSYGNGTVFRVTTNGVLTTLAFFNGTNGAYPQATLTLGGDGNFYGTTYSGGTFGDGTLFRATTNGLLTTLVSLGNADNGAMPYAGLTEASNGDFYGTTYSGDHLGTVFRVTTNGVLTTLYSFGTISDPYGNPFDGAWPYAGLTLGRDGNFYGTTSAGGLGEGHGTVFQMTTSGLLTTLVSFNSTNGYGPVAGLTLGRDGNFYGTTSEGDSDNLGTVFRMTSNGVLTTLVSFNGTNGAHPEAGLTIGDDGNFYGTTGQGGSTWNGTVFRLTSNGVLTTLVSFNRTNGSGPVAGLTLGGDGNFYGTTYSGGTFGQGTIFRVTANGVLTTLVSFNGTNGTDSEAA
jgi:uncharacterized repeat protein (TIGR03803 family)